MNFTRRNVTLAETGNRWLWREHGRYFNTVVDAKRAVQKYARELAPSVVQVDWVPATDLGRRLVKAVVT